MDKMIVLDEVTLVATSIVEDSFVNKPTGNELKTFEVTFRISGKAQQEKVADILSKPKISFAYPFDEAEYFVKAKNNSWGYSGSELNETTLITYTAKLEELDKDLPEDWDYKTAFQLETIFNWARTRALHELLVEKGIITTEEYVGKIKQVQERDAQEMSNYLFFGKKGDKKEKDSGVE